MAFIKEEKNTFDKELIGSFGDFETSSSYELNYLMTTLDISDINDLSSAADILKLEETNFEELIQRDIDYERVDKQIIKHYLEQGKDKAIFFPPMLVSPMIIKEGKALERFEEKKIYTDESNGELTINWDNHIELVFPIFASADSTYPYVIKNEKDEKIAIHNYATTLKYKSKTVKLVVIDGQHRFMALKRIWDDPEKRKLIEKIKIPICIFFTPNAIEGYGSSSLTKSMRQLFVTINSTAKQVSGHFITLLNDEVLSSFAVRDLANDWKENNLLFFLEWNEREEKRSSQINRLYSITTVKIIDSALKETIFKPGITSSFLKLEQFNKEWKNNISEDDYVNIYDIANNSFAMNMIDDIKTQLRHILTPCLDLLFFEPKPYQNKKMQFEKALVYLNKEVDNHTTGAEYFKNHVLYQFRETSKYDVSASKDIEIEFLSHFSTKVEDEFYFKNIFQQAYINAWFDIYEEAKISEFIDAKTYTKAFVSSISQFCFESDKQLFAFSKEYTQNVFYKNARILVNSTAKMQLSNLIKSLFLNIHICNHFISNFESKNQENIQIKLYELANIAIKNYFDVYKKNNFSDIKNNWRTMLDSESDLYSKLNTIEREIKDKEGQKNFEDEIRKIVDFKFDKAKRIFFNTIETNEDPTL